MLPHVQGFAYYNAATGTTEYVLPLPLLVTLPDGIVTRYAPLALFC